MSVLINTSNLSPEQLRQIDADLQLAIANKSGPKQTTTYIQAYRMQSPLVFIPFAYGIKHGFSSMVHRPCAEPLVFKGKLRDEQKVVRNEAMDILNRQQSVILSTHVGFGKSILATYFAYKIRMKTLIIVNRLVLIEQWTQVLQNFIDSPKVHVIKTQTIIDWDCDFFIVNAINMPKIGYMPEIGLVIVDEVHLIVSKILSTCFQYLTPQYLIGLSATPYRNDGLDILLDLHFGIDRIDRQLQRLHHVYRVNTHFVPTIQKQTNGKVDWNHILNQQATNEARNATIVEIVRTNSHHFLVLCKRVEQIKLLETMLRDRLAGAAGKGNLAVHIDCIYGDRQPVPIPDPAAFKKIVLIGTIQKVGTGFDAPFLNALIVASDLEAYFIQYLGRVFRKQDTVPVVFDLVDDYSILKKHYKTREKTYLQHGGVLKKP